MRYFIYSNKDEKSLKIRKTILNRLNNEDFTYDETNPQLVITVGGDGCFLRSIQHFIDKLNSVAFVGISTGSLGFVCDFNYDEVDKMIDLIIQNQPRYEANKLLEVTYKDNIYYFFNEFRLESIFNTLNLSIYINGDKFESFRGKGISIATPFGSTAYNKSLGGPIVHPRLPSLILAKIAPVVSKISSSINSFVLFRHYDVITLKGNFNDCVFGGDTTHQNITSSENEEIKITTSQNAVIFARYNSADYYKRVKRSF